MGEEPPTYANMASKNRRLNTTNLKFNMPKQDLTISTSMKNFKVVANMNSERIVKSLQAMKMSNNLHTLQINGGRCEITMKTRESKERILKDGIMVEKQRIRFGDDANRLFNVTICGMPAEFDGKTIIHAFSKFGEIGNSYYPVHKTGETVWRNGNLVIQYTNINQSLPKFFFVGHRKVKCVFSKIPEFFKTQDFIGDDEDWGASAILDRAPDDVNELARGEKINQPIRTRLH